MEAMSEEVEVEDQLVEETDAETQPEITDEQEYLQEFQKVATDVLGIKPPVEEAVEEEPESDPDTLEFEFQGQSVPVKKQDLFRLAQIGAQSAKREADLAARAQKLDQLAAQLEDVNSIAGGVANFVSQDREGIASTMIANIIAGKPVQSGLEEYDLTQFLGGQPAPLPRRARRPEPVEEADDDDDELDLEDDRPKRRAKAETANPQFVAALQGVTRALQQIQKRQDEIDQREQQKREAEQEATRKAQQRAFMDQIETAILRTPALAELPRADAIEMMRAKMQSTGSRDPKLIAGYWAKALEKRDKKVATTAIREQNKVAKKNAALPAGGALPTGRVQAAAKAKQVPRNEEELVAQLMQQLEALEQGQ